MARVEKSIEIDSTPDKIWPLLFWDRLPEWLGTIKEAEYTSDEKERLGATAHVVAEAAGVKAEWDVEITEYVKNKKAIWRTTRGNLTAVGSTILELTDAGTKVTFVIDYDLPYSILGKVIDRLVVGRDMEKDIENGMKKLKEMTEK